MRESKGSIIMKRKVVEVFKKSLLLIALAVVAPIVVNQAELDYVE